MTSVTVANAYGSRKDGFVFLELTPADQAEDPPQSSSNATAST